MLGQGDSDSVPEPTMVESLLNDRVVIEDVHIGESHTTVLTDAGDVLTTGSASYGRLGNGETSDDHD